jgi:hypothetical protein
MMAKEIQDLFSYVEEWFVIGKVHCAVLGVSSKSVYEFVSYGFWLRLVIDYLQHDEQRDRKQ